jgi:hypothetical protein
MRLAALGCALLVGCSGGGAANSAKDGVSVDAGVDGSNADATLDGGATGDAGEVDASAPQDASTAADAPPDRSEDGDVLSDGGGFVAPVHCDGPEPVLSLGAYPEAFTQWPVYDMYDGKVVELHASTVGIFDDLTNILIVDIGSMRFSGSRGLVTTPPVSNRLEGARATLQVPSIGSVAAGDRIAIGKLNWEYFGETPNIAIGGELLSLGTYPNLVADLGRLYAYQQDVALYNYMRRGSTVGLTTVIDNEGPFNCQFGAAYDYNATFRMESLICGAMPPRDIKAYTGRQRVPIDAQAIQIFVPDTPRNCGFVPDGSFDWTHWLDVAIDARDLERARRVYSSPPSLSL